MYNFSFSAVLPFTATAAGFDRLLKSLVGIIIIPLLMLIGISAILSDFGKIKSHNSGKSSIELQSVINSDFNVGRSFDSSPSQGFNAGDILGKGMIFCSVFPDDQSVNSSLNKDCDKLKSVVYDPTIYLSVDMVDNPPELIWMIYPDLSQAGFADVQVVQVTLSVLVDYSGKPLEVLIDDETLIGNSAKQIILESARTAVFKPAQKNNRSVNCWVQIPLELEV